MRTNVTVVFLLLVLIALVVASEVSKRNGSTDSLGERPGMRLHVDHETGVNYLSVQGGGITPRLRSDGTIYVSQRP